MSGREIAHVAEFPSSPFGSLVEPLLFFVAGRRAWCAGESLLVFLP